MEKLKLLIEKIDFLRFMTALTVMSVLFIITNALLFREIPENNKEIVIHLLGIIEGAVMTIVTYEFGSSKGSDKKNELLAKTKTDTE